MENLANSRIRGDRQQIFINNEKIVGIQNISIEPALGAAPIRYLSMSNKQLSNTVRGSQIGTASIEGYLINKDTFYSLTTGSDTFNLYILRSQNDLDNNYCLISGFATSFSCKYSYNSPVQVSTSISFFNGGLQNTGQLTSTQMSQLQVIRTGVFTGVSIIPDSASIGISINDFQSSRVTSVDLSVNANKSIIYNCGNRNPARIQSLPPFDITMTVGIDLGILPLISTTGFPQIQKIENLTISVSGQNSSQQICSWSFSGLLLANQSYSSSVEGNTVITNKYQGQFIP